MPLKISDDEFNRLVTYVHENYGINLRQKRVLVEGRLSNELARRHYNDYTSFLNMVFTDKSGTEMVALLNKLTTNHTYFMREEEHYTFMKDVFLPYIEKTNASTRNIQLWSAGCSSGEEAYTTQMQMQEYFGTKASSWDTRILATDISMRVLEKAQQAIYHEESMKNLQDTWKRRYFTSVGNECYKVNSNITSKVIFKVFNLMDPIPFKKRKFDLIFCRNVMIYFDMPTKLALVNRFYDVLAPGGYLFIGHAESIPRDKTKFEYVKPAIYRKPLK